MTVHALWAVIGCETIERGYILNQDYEKKIETMPPSVQRWLQRSLPDEFELPSSITIKQEGEMEIRGNWTPFRAEGIYKSPPLSFNWRAKLQMMRGVWIVAEDGHSGEEGWGGAKLWGVIPMGRRADPEVLLTQVVRNVGEIPWILLLALADSSLEWTGSDENAFEIRTNAGDNPVTVRFDVSESGDVIRAHSPARPYDVPGGYEDAPWTVEFGDHRRIGGIWMPGTGVATYHKEEGDWEYFRARIMDVSLETVD